MEKLKEMLFKKRSTARILSALCVLLPGLLSVLAILVFTNGEKTLIQQIAFDTYEGIAATAIVCVAALQALLMIAFTARAAIKGRCSFGIPIVALTLAIAYMAAGQIFAVVGGGQVICFVVSMILSVLAIVYTVVANKVLGPIDDNQEFIVPKVSRVNYIITLLLNVISLIVLSMIFFIPLYSGTDAEGNPVSFIIMQGFSGTKDLVLLISFIAVLIIYIIACSIFLGCLKYFFWKDKRFSSSARYSMFTNFIMTILFFVVGEVIVFMFNTSEAELNVTTTSYIPFLVEAIVTVIHSFFNAKNQYAESKMGIKKGARRAKWIIFLFVTLFTGATALCLSMDLVTVRWTADEVEPIFTIVGWDLLFNKNGSADGWSLVTFLVFAIVMLSVIMYVLSFTAVFAKSSEMKRIGLATIMMNFAFVVVIGLFGKYYQIVEDVNAKFINEYINQFYKEFADYLEAWGIPWTDIAWEGRSVSSGCFYIVFVDIGLAVALFFFKPFTKAEQEMVGGEVSLINGEETLKVEIMQPIAPEPVAAAEKPEPEPVVEEKAVEDEKIEEPAVVEEEVAKLKDFDACPAFSELDSMQEEFDAKNAARRAKLYENPALPDLTDFIVNYAREDKKHLSYTHEGIAEFIAGLGATKLSILQGMSGTGKTSLPLIFLKALMGSCDIVEVESSWKDKNELIGYYNEFSKTFTPKKFTKYLYQAALNPEVITLIVLDEMNLSRIEYYFSDFLSLMENDPENRKIQLCNVKLYNTYENEKHGYSGLEKGHTLHIPANVWFIGTANRDESTFEISDKVYDRANTINFDKRAPKVRNWSQPLDERYLTYTDFQRILDEAVKASDFDLESVPYLKDVEALLRPYNISFGNRILNQIEKYVKIYSQCFANPKEREAEALEKILLSKVVHKLEFKAVEDKQSLIRGFEKINLLDCAEFVKGLNEDF